MFRAYGNEKLCILDCLTEYLRRREEKVYEYVTKLTIPYCKPYKIASDDTIKRWIKELFQTCSIVGFTAHTYRSASTSKAVTLKIEDPWYYRKYHGRMQKPFTNIT